MKKKSEVCVPFVKSMIKSDNQLSKDNLRKPYIIYEKICDTDEVNYDKIDYVASKEDIEFADNIGVSEETFCKMIDLFEKISGPLTIYNGYGQRIEIKEMICKMNNIKPDYPYYFNIQYQSKEEQVLQIYNLIQPIYTYWNQLRAQRGSVLLRQFWRRYQCTNEEEQAIFRERFEDVAEKKRNLRSKSKHYYQEYFDRINEWFQSSITAFEIGYQLVRRETRKHLQSLHEQIQFENELISHIENIDYNDLKETSQMRLEQLINEYLEFYEKNVMNDHTLRIRKEFEKLQASKYFQNSQENTEFLISPPQSPIVSKRKNKEDELDLKVQNEVTDHVLSKRICKNICKKTVKINNLQKKYYQEGNAIQSPIKLIQTAKSPKNSLKMEKERAADETESEKSLDEENQKNMRKDDEDYNQELEDRFQKFKKKTINQPLIDKKAKRKHLKEQKEYLQLQLNSPISNQRKEQAASSSNGVIKINLSSILQPPQKQDEKISNPKCQFPIQMVIPNLSDPPNVNKSIQILQQQSEKPLAPQILYKNPFINNQLGINQCQQSPQQLFEQNIQQIQSTQLFKPVQNLQQAFGSYHFKPSQQYVPTSAISLIHNFQQLQEQQLKINQEKITPQIQNERSSGSHIQQVPRLELREITKLMERPQEQQDSSSVILISEPRVHLQDIPLILAPISPKIRQLEEQQSNNPLNHGQNECQFGQIQASQKLELQPILSPFGSPSTSYDQSNLQISVLQNNGQYSSSSQDTHDSSNRNTESGAGTQNTPAALNSASQEQEQSIVLMKEEPKMLNVHVLKNQEILEQIRREKLRREQQLFNKTLVNKISAVTPTIKSPTPIEKKPPTCPIPIDDSDEEVNKNKPDDDDDTVEIIDIKEGKKKQNENANNNCIQQMYTQKDFQRYLYSYQTLKNHLTKNYQTMINQRQNMYGRIKTD